MTIFLALYLALLAVAVFVHAWIMQTRSRVAIWQICHALIMAIAAYRLLTLGA